MHAPSSSAAAAAAILARQPRLADHSADRRMIILGAMAVVVGSGGAAAAWILLRLIALVTNIAWFGRLSTASVDMAAAPAGPATVLLPVLGGLLIGLMARFGSEKIRGHGIPEAIEAILFGDSRLSPKVAILKPLSSALSIGTGGPFGAEGPIIMTGGAIGSLFAQCFHLSGAERKTLLVAGAAAGMTAIFGTPIAAILLALEVLLFEWKPRSFVPVAVGALTALVWRPLLIGVGPLFPFSGVTPTPAAALAAAPILGLAIGCAAALLSATLYRIEDFFHRLPIHWMWWPAIGGLFVGFGGLIDPHALGAGYGNIADLIGGSLLLRALLLLFLVKAAIWLIALGSGTSGGVLAPLLILGGAIGAIAGQWLGHPGFWALAGMGAMMSAAMRAPLTGAVFAAELAGRIDVLPGVAAAAVIAYAVAVLVLRRSILTEKIARRGRHLSQEYGVDPLELVRVREIMTADPQTLPATLPIAEAVRFFASGAAHRSYPIVDEAGHVIGLVSRADALRWGNDAGDDRATLADRLADASLFVVAPDMTAAMAADLMITEGVGRLPVVDPATGRLTGILARRDLLEARVDGHRAERHRQRFLFEAKGQAASR